MVSCPRANWFRNRAMARAFKNLRESRAQLALIEFAHFQCASHPYDKPIRTRGIIVKYF